MHGAANSITVLYIAYTTHYSGMVRCRPATSDFMRGIGCMTDVDYVLANTIRYTSCMGTVLCHGVVPCMHTAHCLN